MRRASRTRSARCAAPRRAPRSTSTRATAHGSAGASRRRPAPAAAAAVHPLARPTDPLPRLQAFVKLVCRLGLHEHIRGFATNVANYNPLGLACPDEAFAPGETPAHYCHWVAKGAPCCSHGLGACERARLEQYSSGAGELMCAASRLR